MPKEVSNRELSNVFQKLTLSSFIEIDPSKSIEAANKALSRPPIDRRFPNSRPMSQYEETDLSTDALDLHSVLDGATEATSDDDLASRDEDNYLIQKQLEGLEGMYSQVKFTLYSNLKTYSNLMISYRY